jgi:hypothetical protein
LSPKKDFTGTDPLDNPMVDRWIGLLIDDDVGGIAAKLKAGIKPAAFCAVFRPFGNQIELCLASGHVTSKTSVPMANVYKLVTAYSDYRLPVLVASY